MKTMPNTRATVQSGGCPSGGLSYGATRLSWLSSVRRDDIVYSETALRSEDNTDLSSSLRPPSSPGLTLLHTFSISAMASRGGRRGTSSRSRRRATKPIRKSRKRRERPSGRPKRALGPYMFFCKEHHASISADNPNIPFGDVGRILGSRWQQMSEKDKKPYIKKAEADKKRYEKDLKRSKGRR